MDNPTGKYFLDLANTYERAIVMQLIDLPSTVIRNGRVHVVDQLSMAIQLVRKFLQYAQGPMETACRGVLEITIEFIENGQYLPKKSEVIFKRVQDTVRSTKGTEKLAMPANFATLKIFTLIIGCTKHLIHVQYKAKRHRLLSPCHVC